MLQMLLATKHPIRRIKLTFLKMENNITIIRNGTKIQVDYILQYERIIGYDVNHNPKYSDIRFDLYIEDEHFSVFFWIDLLD